MATSPTQIRIDSDLKREVTALFDELGLDLSTAVNLFLHQCIYYGGLPFTVTIPDISETTKAAILEAFEASSDEEEKMLRRL